MIVYLAGRYGRREELCGYADKLRSLGLKVNSRWLLGGHQIDAAGKPIGDHGEALVESGDASGALFAQHDMDDVLSADVVVCFTEEPRVKSTNRGGRHVEMGIALASSKTVVVVGWRENVFCWLPAVIFCEDFTALFNWLNGITSYERVMLTVTSNRQVLP